MKSLPILLCALLVAGCASDIYRPAAPQFTATAGAHADAEVVVLLEPVFPGKAFSEMVCDNVVGVSWSPEESRRIGFTQRYTSTRSKYGPERAMLATLPADRRVAMSASDSSNIGSRILVPFGRFITDNLVQAVGTKGQVCESGECVRRAMQERPKARLVSVHFTKLRVTERKINILTLEIEGMAKVTRADAATIDVPVLKSISRSVSAEGLWHSDFVKAMNNIANESSSAVAAQIRAAGA